MHRLIEWHINGNLFYSGLNCCPYCGLNCVITTPNSYAEVLAPRISECDWIWRQGILFFSECYIMRKCGHPRGEREEASGSQGERPQKEKTQIWGSSTQNSGENIIIPIVLSHLACGNLLQELSTGLVKEIRKDGVDKDPGVLWPPWLMM